MRALIKTMVPYVNFSFTARNYIATSSRIRKRANSQATFKETSQSGDSIRSEIDIEKSRRRTVLRLARSPAGWRWASTKDPRTVRTFRCLQQSPHTYTYIKASGECNVVHNARTCRFKLLEKCLISTINVSMSFILLRSFKCVDN